MLKMLLLHGLILLGLCKDSRLVILTLDNVFVEIRLCSFIFSKFKIVVK
jgi:hypothetical protein